MPELATTYLGLNLRNPFVASASPISKKVETVQQLEEAGAGAVVMHSLFEEQITYESLELDHYLEFGTNSYAESLSYFPDFASYNIGPEAYLEHLRKLKSSVSIPVIASLNGVSSGGWVDYAKQIQQAGADALELNIYYLATNPNLSSTELEETYIALVRNISEQITIPVAVKLSPFFTSLPHMAKRLIEAGARGLVLFNRFYQPDIDLESLAVVPNLELSRSAEMRLPLRWIAILYGRIQADLALTTGVHSANDAIKAILAGAQVTMIASELLDQGIGRLKTIVSDFEKWLTDHEYESVNQMRGSVSQQSVADPAAFERANYLKTLNSYAKVIS
jgi:dihydroorotate dehydrogenase (fumarate)